MAQAIQVPLTVIFFDVDPVLLFTIEPLKDPVTAGLNLTKRVVVVTEPDEGIRVTDLLNPYPYVVETSNPLSAVISRLDVSPVPDTV